MASLSAATESNPSYMPERYEIRRLTKNEIPWVSAIVIHSNCFHSNIFTVTYPDGLTERAYSAFKVIDYLVRHQVESGHSFGVFDLQYEYKTEEARKAGGKVMWNLEDTNATGNDLLGQMDFPLVSVAMAYDGINHLDMERLMPLMGTLPCFGTIYHTLETLDTRDPAIWEPKGPKEVLLRNATSTRRDHEGKGLMRKMANWLMRYAAELGFRGIQIECIADQVTHVWSNPPAPFKGAVVSEFQTEECKEEQEVDGVKKEVNPFGNSVQRVAKVYVELKPPVQTNGATH